MNKGNRVFKSIQKIQSALNSKKSERRIELTGLGKQRQWIYGPGEHRLDTYRRAYPYYDEELPRLAELIQLHGRDGPIIDIGANIGDTAALMRLAGARQKIVCIEPSKRYYEFLTRNIRAFPDIFSDVSPIWGLVAEKHEHVALVEERGTARTAASGAQSIDAPHIALSELDVDKPSLVKIDTDGYDAKIISANIEWLAKERPILWAEAQTGNKDGVTEWKSVLTALAACYEYATLFDNFGFRVATVKLGAETISMISDLILYTVESERSHRTIYYFDICFWPKECASIRRAFTEDQSST
jgi:FkbM family methyltransferase